jgi:rubrerythrin
MRAETRELHGAGTSLAQTTRHTPNPETTMAETMQTEVQLVAELNDLLQLDHDALQAYDLAIGLFQARQYRDRVKEFRGDHERHVQELTTLIKAYGGVPVQLPHLPTGVFKLAVQGAAAAGGDKAVLLAFRANERQTRDRYRRAADGAHPPEAAGILREGADDESRHYDWAAETLSALGLGADTGHARIADTVESAERQGMAMAEGARRGIMRSAQQNPVGTVLLAVGAGLVAGALLGGSRRS